MSLLASLPVNGASGPTGTASPTGGGGLVASLPTNAARPAVGGESLTGAVPSLNDFRRISFADATPASTPPFPLVYTNKSAYLDAIKASPTERPAGPTFEINPVVSKAGTGSFLPVAKEIGQSIARNIGSAGLTLSGVIQSKPDDPDGKVIAESLSAKDFESYFGQALFDTVFGEGEELKPIETRIAEAEPKIKAWQDEISKVSETPGLSAREKIVTQTLANLNAPTLAFAGIMGSVGLDLTPVGGLERNLYKKLVEEATEEGARALLHSIGVEDSVAQKLALQVPNIKTTEEAKAFVNTLGNMQAEITQGQKGITEQKKLPVDPRAQEAFDQVLEKTNISGDRTMALAQKIAAKMGSDTVKAQHLLEAAQYTEENIRSMHRIDSARLLEKGDAGIETYMRAKELGVEGLDPNFEAAVRMLKDLVKDVAPRDKDLLARIIENKIGKNLGVRELDQVSTILETAKRIQKVDGAKVLTSMHLLEATHFGGDLQAYLKTADATGIKRLKQIYDGELPIGGSAMPDLHSAAMKSLSETPKEYKEAIKPHLMAVPAAKNYADTIASQIASRLGAIYHATGIKGIPRIVEKAVADYGGDFSKVKDYVRGTITVDDSKGAMKALEDFRTTDHPVGEPKMNLDKPMANGFRTVMQNGKAPNGHVFEMQFTTHELLEAKYKFGDALYNQSRSIEAKAKAAGRKLTKKEQAQIAFLENKMKKLYADAYARGNRRLASAKDTTSPSARAVDKEGAPSKTSRQRSPENLRQLSDEQSNKTPSKTTKPGDKEAIDSTLAHNGGKGKPPSNASVGISGDPGSPENIQKKIVAQDFRVDKLNLTDEEEADIVARLDAMGMYQRTVKTFDEMRAAAEELGTDVPTLLREVKSNRITSDEAVALKNVINSSAQKLDEVEKKLLLNPEDKQLLRDRDIAEYQIDAALKKLIKGGTEAGRAVASFKILANRSMDPAVWFAKASRVLEGQEFTNDMRKAIMDLIGKNDRQGLAEFVSMLRKPSFAEKAVTLWKAGLLTSFTTHLANIGGNLTMNVLSSASDLVAMPLDVLIALKTGERTTVTGIKPLVAKLKGAKEGAKNAAEYIKTGAYSADMLAKYDLPKAPVFKNKILHAYTEAVFRSLGAEDIFFRQAALSESMEKQALVMAKNEGLSGAAAKERVKYLLENPTNGMTTQAIDDAEYLTFTSDNVMAKFISTGKNYVKGQGLAGETLATTAEVVMPFVRTPTNVAARIADFSPAGFIKAMVRFANPTTRSQKNLVRDLSRAITGTGVMGFGAYLYQKGLMTGNAPDNAKERDQFYSEGKQPNSVYLFGKWHSLNRISPVGNLMGLGAEFERIGEETSGLSLGVATAAAGAKSLTQQTFLKGIAGALQAINDPERSAQTYLEQTVGSVVPSIIGRTARTIDPTQRMPDGVVESLQSRIPFLSDSLPARRDVFGNAMEVPGGRFNLIDPFQSTDASKSPLFDEAKRIGVTIGQPGKTYAKTTLTNKEYAAYQMVRGRMLEEALTNLVASPEYQGLKTSQQTEKFEDTITAVNKAVSEQLFPSLMVIRYDLPKETNPVVLRAVLTELNAQPKFKKGSIEWQGRVVRSILQGAQK